MRGSRCWVPISPWSPPSSLARARGGAWAYGVLSRRTGLRALNAGYASQILGSASTISDSSGIPRLTILGVLAPRRHAR